jgi:glycosyltransferase involved in cell wall biosynthesis
MASELVSVGIPFTSVDYLLLRALDSVRNQTHRNLEIILYGDGVRDSDLQKLEAIDDDRVRVHHSTEQRGLAATLNAIAHLANGRLLFRMDSDDIMFEDRVAKMLDFFARRPECDVLSSRAIVIDEHERLHGLLKQTPLKGIPGDFIESGAVVHPTVAARTEWFLNNQYDPEYARAQDKELWLRSCMRSTFYRLEEPLLFYLIDTSSASDKSLLSARYNRKALRRYGPALVGYPRTATLLAKAWVGAMRTKWFSRFGVSNVAYSTRFIRIDDADYASYEEQLRTMKTVARDNTCPNEEGV